MYSYKDSVCIYIYIYMLKFNINIILHVFQQMNDMCWLWLFICVSIYIHKLCWPWLFFGHNTSPFLTFPIDSATSREKKTKRANSPPPPDQENKNPSLRIRRIREKKCTGPKSMWIYQTRKYLLLTSTGATPDFSPRVHHWCPSALSTWPWQHTAPARLGTRICWSSP